MYGKYTNTQKAIGAHKKIISTIAGYQRTPQGQQRSYFFQAQRLNTQHQLPTWGQTSTRLRLRSHMLTWSSSHHDDNGDRPECSVLDISHRTWTGRMHPLLAIFPLKVCIRIYKMTPAKPRVCPPSPIFGCEFAFALDKRKSKTWPPAFRKPEQTRIPAALSRKTCRTCCMRLRTLEPRRHTTEAPPLQTSLVQTQDRGSPGMKDLGCHMWQGAQLPVGSTNLASGKSHSKREAGNGSTRSLKSFYVYLLYLTSSFLFLSCLSFLYCSFLYFMFIHFSCPFSWLLFSLLYFY